MDWFWSQRPLGWSLRPLEPQSPRCGARTPFESPAAAKNSFFDSMLGKCCIYGTHHPQKRQNPQRTVQIQ